MGGNDLFLDTDNSINGAIREIRQALTDDPEQPHFVQTITGRGYRFIAPVLEAGAPSAPKGAVSAQHPQFVPLRKYKFLLAFIHSSCSLVAQWASEFEITLSKKPCKRSLNPVGSSKTRSSPVMTSILRVLS
jgi:hypothetical protein